MKNLINKLKWEKDNGLVPAIIQDANSGGVLMLGYMNKESLIKTFKTQKVWFYSRSRQRLWMKGETSRNYLHVADIIPDCDNDILLIKANPAGPTCHTGKISCFANQKPFEQVLGNLYNTIIDRKKKMPKNSYTAKLFKAGTSIISAKVIEEAVEVAQAIKKESKKKQVEETVDLIYHMLVLWAEKNITLEDVSKELEKRKK